MNKAVTAFVPDSGQDFTRRTIQQLKEAGVTDVVLLKTPIGSTATIDQIAATTKGSAFTFGLSLPYKPIKLPG